MFVKVLVFGNPLAKVDSAAVKIAEKLKGTPNIEFVRFDTAEDLEKEGSNPVILDTVIGIKIPRLVELNELELSKVFSLHDFDLGWNLTLLKKLGKIKSATVIGVPPESPEKNLQAVKQLLLSLANASRPSST